MYLSCFKHTRARITVLNVFKHEISVARQRYRLGTTDFATLKSFTQWYFDKKTKFRGNTVLFRIAHHFFREIASKSHTIYKKYYYPVDTDLVTATGTAAISILRLGRLYCDTVFFFFNLQGRSNEETTGKSSNAIIQKSHKLIATVIWNTSPFEVFFFFYAQSSRMPADKWIVACKNAWFGRLCLIWRLCLLGDIWTDGFEDSVFKSEPRILEDPFERTGQLS